MYWLLEEVTWEEAKEIIAKADYIILPTGSFEQHGLHLPLSVDDIKAGDQVSCSECGGKPPSGYNVIAEDTPDVNIEFEVGDESYWEWTSVSFGFSFSSGKTISFGASISAVRKSINPPYLRVIVHSWSNQEHCYYYWFEDNNKHSHIIHMSWIPP
jgi:hypothetical protein